MNYVLTFKHATGAYRAHRLGCVAANSTKAQTVLEEVFASITGASSYADADESEKAGQLTKANFKACKCCTS